MSQLNLSDVMQALHTAVNCYVMLHKQDPEADSLEELDKTITQLSLIGTVTAGGFETAEIIPFPNPDEYHDE